jgi:hypothetical protein
MDSVNTLYVDTNIFLHYPPLDQIDWQSLTQGDRVELVVCMPVIHELDEKKNDPLLGQRAKRSLQDISRLSQPNVLIRDGVALRTQLEEAVPSEMSAPLVHAVRDDQIIHLAKTAAASGKKVLLVSEDTGIILKGRLHGLPCVCPHSDTRLENPLSTQAQTIRDLQADLARYKSRRAQLVVKASSTPSSADASTEVILIQRAGQALDAVDVMREVRRRHRPIREGVARSYVPLLDSGMISVEAARQYNNKLKTFYHDYEEYLHAVEAYAQKRARILLFSLWLVNVGTLTGEDISIDVIFPLGFARMSLESKAKRTWDAPPQAPTPPKFPRSIGASIQYSPPTPVGPDLVSIVPRPKTNVTGPQISLERGAGLIRFRVTNLRHHDTIGLGRYAALLEQATPIRPFEVTYTARDTTNIEPSVGKVLFKLSA